MIPRQHQVNLPSFPSLTSQFSNWWSWGTVVTPRLRRTAVEAAIGSPGCPPPPAPGSRPHGPAAAAARVPSERGRSLRPARCSLCASESRRPTSLSALPTPAGPPAPGLSPLPSLLFLCFFPSAFQPRFASLPCYKYMMICLIDKFAFLLTVSTSVYILYAHIFLGI